jgi:tetratricopeptide (TPR) repeat protein
MSEVGVITDWRSIPGNPDAFDLLRRMVHTRQTVAFVGAGASAGLYPLWTGLIKELANRAVSRGASDASRQFWMKNVDKLPDVVVAGIKRALDQGSYAELLREIFRSKSGADGNYFTPLQSALIRLPFKGYITTNFDPGLLEARYRLRPDSRPTGFGTWRDTDVVARWQSGDVFSEQQCPILFAHGIYERPDTIVLSLDEYRQAYRSGPFRRLFESIWRQQRIVFVGLSFTDQWIRTVANEGLFSGEQGGAPRHVALIGLRPSEEYTPEMRRAVADQYSTDVLFYPIVPASDESEDHGALHSILSELMAGAVENVAQIPPSFAQASSDNSRLVPQRWAHESTEDETFTGRSRDLVRLDRLSADPEVRVIAITGMGGLGKTSLVGHWVKTRSSSMRRQIKGVLFWSIYADRDVRNLFLTIIRFAVDQVGVAAPRSQQELAATALEMLRKTPMLLVIDGLEVLQDVPSAAGYGAFLREELRELLDGACRLKHGSLILLTSRFPFADLTPYLGRGFRSLQLERLTDSEGASLLATCDVTGTQGERGEVSRKLNGHPLALRLVALAVTRRGQRDLTHGLQEIFELATLSEEIPLERKLKHLLEFYERGMPKAQTALLGIVSFFRSLAPKITILALARHLPAVADATRGSSDAALEDALGMLARQHLLIGDTANESWSCHPILRDHFRQTLLGWAPGIAIGAASILAARPAHDEPSDIAALEPVLAAVELLIDANDFVGADQLYRERLNHGRLFRQLAAPSEGMRCALAFIRDPERRGRCERVLGKERLAAFANMVGVSARQTGEFEFGTKYLEECTNIYKECNQRVELSVALENWAGLLIVLGNLIEAERKAREAIEVATITGATLETRGSLTYLGTILGKRGHVDAALTAFASATEIERREHPNVEGLFSRRGIRFADLLLRLGRKQEAKRLTEANLRICVDNSWREEAAQCWGVLGEIALQEEWLSEAREQFGTAESIFRSGYTVVQLPRIMILRGELERQQGNLDQANAAIEEALTLAAPRQMKLDHADALLARARLELDRSFRATLAIAEASANRANDDAEAALTIARESGYAWAERDALQLLARSNDLLGLSDRAESFSRESRLLSERLRDPAAVT